MSGFRRGLFGYRRAEVESALSIQGAHILDLERKCDTQSGSISEMESECASLAEMVFEREREIRVLGERLREANACHDRSIASLDAITARLEEVEAQARGQATRIRMKALREAVDVGRRAQELSDAEGLTDPDGSPQIRPSNGRRADAISQETFEGTIKM